MNGSAQPNTPTTAEFLAVIFQETPGDRVLWTRQDKKARFYSLDDHAQMKRDAPELAKEQDVYFGIALQDKEEALKRKIEQEKIRAAKAGELPRELRYEHVRGGADTVGAIVVLAMDIDFKEGVHKNNALPSRAEALEFVKALPISPSIVVDSGGGLHLYWLLDKPWIIQNEEDRQRIASLSERLQAEVIRLGKDHGWKFDNTSDLARVLRVPGTFNRKGPDPLPVRIMQFSPNARYSVEQLEKTFPVVETPKETKEPARSHVDQSKLDVVQIFGELTKLHRCGKELAGAHPIHGSSTGTNLGINPDESVWCCRRCGSGGDALYAIAVIEGILECEEAVPGGLRGEKFIQAVKIANEKYGAGIVLPPIPKDQSKSAYSAKPEGTFVVRYGKGGDSFEVQLANFTARITHETVLDDGSEERRLFELEANIHGRKEYLSIPSNEFMSMDWVISKLGAEAVITPGSGSKDHMRAAIQIQSLPIPKRHAYAHLGWRKINNQFVFLHAGGAIGPNGAVPEIGEGVMILPNPLGKFRLPNIQNPRQAIEAVKASIRILSIASNRIVFPPYAATWRSVLGGSDFTLHFSGLTGTGKSVVAALMQQHFGAEMNYKQLPGAWSSTANSLEGVAYAAKDVLFVVDDYVPSGHPGDRQVLDKVADRVIRAQGNGSARMRMNADGSLRPVKPPRCLMLSTGEDVPPGQSLRARLFIVEMTKTELQWLRINDCQSDAANGLYAQAMSGFIQWLSPNYEKIQNNLRREIASFRERASIGKSHRRTPEIIAQLALGLRYFLDYALEIGAISDQESKVLWNRGWTAFLDDARDQAEHHAENDPSRRFLELIHNALLAGKAHLESLTGGAPQGREDSCGWTSQTRNTGGDTVVWKPQGNRIGWIDGENVYLLPSLSYAIAQQMGRDVQNVIPVAEKTLHKRLKEAGLLASFDQDRHRNTVRKTIPGHEREEVLHLWAKDLLSVETAQSSQLARFIVSPEGFGHSRRVDTTILAAQNFN